MDRKVIILGVVAAAGGLGCVLYRRQKEQEAAALLAAGIQPVRPGFLETITGAATAAFSQGLSKLTQPTPSVVPPTGLEALQAKILKRGSAHHLAWSAAFRTGKGSYSVGGKCYRTADGLELGLTTQPVCQLEGYY